MSERAEGSPPDAPGGEVSDQNREEASHPPGGPGAGREHEDNAQGGSQRRGREAEDGGRPGGAGEDSQATGHPDNAG